MMMMMMMKKKKNKIKQVPHEIRNVNLTNAVIFGIVTVKAR